jgi:hypothetical protein
VERYALFFFVSRTGLIGQFACLKGIYAKPGLITLLIGRTLTIASEYRLRTVQCLVTSDYTRSVDNTIETLMLYVHGEYSIRSGAEVALWIIIGMIVRLAMRKSLPFYSRE